MAPVIYFFNVYFCLTIIPKTDKAFYPSTFARYFSYLNLFMFSMLVLVLGSNLVVLFVGWETGSRESTATI